MGYGFQVSLPVSFYACQIPRSVDHPPKGDIPDIFQKACSVGLMRFYAYAIFEFELAFLICTASMLIYLTLSLFFTVTGLVVLLYTTQRSI